MLLNTVIIILREVLEATMIVSVFLAFAHLYQVPLRALWWVPILSLFGLFIYVMNIELITDALDGVGQEVLNASLQFIIYIALVLFSITIMAPKWRHWVGSCMMLAMTLAMIREGAEIVLYLQGFLSAPTGMLSIFLGSLIGLGIGVSIGVLIYYLLISRDAQGFLWMGFALLFLIAGGMIMQTTQLLIQADWLPSQAAAWNSSHLIGENTIIGQLLYALLGYEATPSPIQVVCYVFGVLLISSLTWLAYQKNKAIK